MSRGALPARSKQKPEKPNMEEESEMCRPGAEDRGSGRPQANF